MVARAAAAGVSPDRLLEEEDDARAAASARVPRPAAPQRRATDPDAEAREIAMRIVEKVAVAKSLARLFGGIARENAAVAGEIVRAYADKKMLEVVEREGLEEVLPEGARVGDGLLRTVAGAVGAMQVERATKIARALAESAMHAAQAAAARAAARAADASADATPDPSADVGADAVSGPRRAVRRERPADAVEPLDHDALHDDAC